MNHDFRSPVWLQASVRHARDYQPDRRLAAELHAAGPAAVSDAMNTMFASFSNRALREVADAASNWITDLSQIDDADLVGDLRDLKVAAQIICDYASNARLARQVADGRYERR